MLQQWEYAQYSNSHDEVYRMSTSINFNGHRMRTER